MSEFDKEHLLHVMSKLELEGAVGEAEPNDRREFMKNFLPIPDHWRALDPNTFLILGGRGAGKTQLFRLLALPEGREALGAQPGAQGLEHLKHAVWITGFGSVKRQGKTFPTNESVEQHLQGATSLDWRAFWVGLLMGIILRYEDPSVFGASLDDMSEDVRNALVNHLPLLSKWHPLVLRELESLNYALDQLDDHLIQKDNWLFIKYDDLDKVAMSYSGLAAPIRELLAFWLDRSRRWERVRPKIFLRIDLFQEEFLGFPDASKLKGKQIRLDWQKSWLYRLLLKRLANSDEHMLDYLRQVPKLIRKKDPILGYMPSKVDERHEKFMEMIIGKYMGKDPRKGFSYRWVPNHLQDADGRLVPRSFLKLFAAAAEGEISRFDRKQLEEERLLQPTSLQGALQETSEDRIRELQEEYPWLEVLKERLKGLEVPSPRSEFIRRMKDIDWESQQIKPPAQNPEEILKHLVKLGILENRLDTKINMPYIYRYGFGMKHRGGIKQPK